VSPSYNVPMSLFTDAARVYFKGRPLGPGQQPPMIMFNLAEPAYFGTMRVPIVRGRPFTQSDNETSAPVAIVNQTMAEKFWPSEDPIGKRFSIDTASNRFLEVVGVVAKGVYNTMGEEPQPLFYLQTYRTMGATERKRPVQDVLDGVGVAHRAKHYPAQLSGGQQQRMAVARALVNQPSILLADEPTGNLDSKNSEAVMDLLRQLNADGATMCMVTHDLRYASIADRMIHLFEGRIVEEISGTAGIVI
jgi:energy-coupling factor transporter ATP-binding protein EcfA2